MISIKEKNALFKAADEQLAARVLNSKGRKVTARLIERTFNSLDIEAIIPVYFGKKNKEIDNIINLKKSENIDDKVSARKKIRADKEVRVWVSSKIAGVEIEREKLCDEFKITKGI